MFAWFISHRPILLPSKNIANESIVKKINFRDDKDKIIIYVVRIQNSGKAGMAKPCPNCAYVLGKKQFKAIYYTNNNGYFEKL